MTNGTNKIYDLEERAARFGEEIVKFAKSESPNRPKGRGFKVETIEKILLATEPTENTEDLFSVNSVPSVANFTRRIAAYSLVDAQPPQGTGVYINKLCVLVPLWLTKNEQ